MISGILAKKVGMTQIFQEGKCLPVTLLEAGPCVILQVKKQDKDGYSALQLGFDERRKKSSTRPEIGHAEKGAHTGPKKFVKEIIWDEKDEVKAGDTVNVSVLEKCQYVDIVGTSKGRGFMGCVRRYHFKGGAKSHGQSDRLRAPGAIGGSTPFKVHKGTRMPGHMGNAQCTLRGLKIIEINAAENVLAVLGSVVGYDGGYVIIKKSRKNKKQA